MAYIKYQQYLCVYLELGSPAVTFVYPYGLLVAHEFLGSSA